MPVSQRSGVIASVATISRSVQMPVVLVIFSIGFAVEVIREAVVDQKRERREAGDPDDGLEHPPPPLSRVN